MRSSHGMKNTGFITLILTLVAVAMVGCKKGEPLSVEPLGVNAKFIADSPSASSYVAFRAGDRRGERITLDVDVTDVNQPVTAIVMKLTYDHDTVRFRGCTDGDLFPQHATCYAAEPDDGTVFIGRSIVAPDQGATVDGTKTIVHLAFLVFGEGPSPITIEAQNIGGSDASALLDVNGNPIPVSWYAGMFVGR